MDNSKLSARANTWAQRTLIYQQAFVLHGFTSSMGDWAYQFAFDDGRALSQQPAGFKQLRMPLHLVWGALDTITPLEQARQLQALAGHATLPTLPGVGHIPKIEDVELFTRRSRSFCVGSHRPALRLAARAENDRVKKRQTNGGGNT